MFSPVTWIVTLVCGIAGGLLLSFKSNRKNKIRSVIFSLVIVLLSLGTFLIVDNKDSVIKTSPYPLTETLIALCTLLTADKTRFYFCTLASFLGFGLAWIFALGPADLTALGFIALGSLTAFGLSSNLTTRTYLLQASVVAYDLCKISIHCHWTVVLGSAPWVVFFPVLYWLDSKNKNHHEHTSLLNT